MSSSILWALVLLLFGANADLHQLLSIARAMCQNAKSHRSE